MMTADTIQLWIAAASLIVTGYFIFLFGKPSERFWRSWFGISLMLIAVAVLLTEISVVLYRIFGDSYPWRDVLRVASQALILAAMSLRTWVLHTAQRQDRIKRPHRLR